MIDDLNVDESPAFSQFSRKIFVGLRRGEIARRMIVGQDYATGEFFERGLEDDPRIGHRAAAEDVGRGLL